VIVLDASVTMTWCFEDQASEATDALLRRVAHEGALARQHGLSAHEASYLRLAARTGAALATLDAALARAARSAGVQISAELS